MQSRVQGYMYNITSETQYSKRMLPPTPPREKEASLPIPARHVSSRAIIDEAPPRQPAPQQSQYRTDRPLVSSRAGAGGAMFRRGSESQVVVCCTPLLHTPECINCRSAFSVHLQAVCTQVFLVAGVALLGGSCFRVPLKRLIQAHSLLWLQLAGGKAECHDFSADAMRAS